jgi:hypothetical protein
LRGVEASSHFQGFNVNEWGNVSIIARVDDYFMKLNFSSPGKVIKHRLKQHGVGTKDTGKHLE